MGRSVIITYGHGNLPPTIYPGSFTGWQEEATHNAQQRAARTESTFYSWQHVGQHEETENILTYARTTCWPTCSLVYGQLEVFLIRLAWTYRSSNNRAFVMRRAYARPIARGGGGDGVGRHSHGNKVGKKTLPIGPLALFIVSPVMLL